ncbi:MAG: hypothetical protein KKB79_00365 [Nanoarchaeota archaeon]|nr:hypothetical protein [Nanoarchaeota archaeon]
MVKEKKKICKKKNTKQKNEILKKLVETLKKNTKKNSKEIVQDKKEKVVDDSIPPDDFDNLTDSNPRKIVNSEGRRAPVLEAIAGEQPGPVFINRGRPASADSDEKSDVGYASKEDDSNEPKYSSSQSSKLYDAQNVRTESLGRTTGTNSEVREVNLIQDERILGESPTQEKIWGVERFDSDKVKRQNPFEREEVKYKEYEPPR